jgi:hypothetical protein
LTLKYVEEVIILLLGLHQGQPLLCLYVNSNPFLLNSLDRPSPAGEDGVIEGTLVRKHEWESTTKKASNRSWDKVNFEIIDNVLNPLLT